MEGGMSLS